MSQTSALQLPLISPYGRTPCSGLFRFSESTEPVYSQVEANNASCVSTPESTRSQMVS